jgi:hypothetical protein
MKPPVHADVDQQMRERMRPITTTATSALPHQRCHISAATSGRLSPRHIPCVAQPCARPALVPACQLLLHGGALLPA